MPCLNEALNLPGLLSELESTREALAGAYELSTIVVDDGSSDETAGIARQWQGTMQVILLSHDVNRGLGCALNTGIDCFLDLSSSASGNRLAVMDADNTHPPRLLCEMLALGADIVIASRYAPGGEEHGLTLLRRLYSRTASLVMGAAAGIHGVRDYSCGYRVYSQAILELGKRKFGSRLVTETGFVCMAELLVKLGRLGAVVQEVPLKLHYELKGGASKMNVPDTIRRYVVLVFNVLFNRSWR
ncbi:glycosyltransferase [bacterium]|nr:glycosyltransferase [bacterium]